MDSTMHKPIRKALKSLLHEFRQESSRYPPLYFERLYPWDYITLQKKTWDAFIKANLERDRSVWQAFDLFPDLGSCGRLFGNDLGLEAFKRLGESFYKVLCELDPFLNRDEGYYGALNVLYRMSEYPTPLLWHKFRVWENDFVCPPNVAQDEQTEAYYAWFDEQMDDWTTDEGGERYLTHPFCLTLVHDVFKSTIGAIQIILDPENALLVGDLVDELPFTFFRKPKKISHSLEPPKANRPQESVVTLATAAIRRKRSTFPDKNELNRLVDNFLKQHHGAPIRDVAKGIGVAAGTVQKTLAWKSERARRYAAQWQCKKKSRESTGKDADPFVKAAGNEAIWNWLLDRAEPSERAGLHEKNAEEKAALIDLARERYDEENLDSDD